MQNLCFRQLKLTQVMDGTDPHSTHNLGPVTQKKSLEITQVPVPCVCVFLLTFLSLPIAPKHLVAIWQSSFRRGQQEIWWEGRFVPGGRGWVEEEGFSLFAWLCKTVGENRRRGSQNMAGGGSSRYVGTNNLMLTGGVLNDNSPYTPPPSFFLLKEAIGPQLN